MIESFGSAQWPFRKFNMRDTQAHTHTQHYGFSFSLLGFRTVQCSLTVSAATVWRQRERGREGDRNAYIARMNVVKSKREDN